MPVWTFINILDINAWGEFHRCGYKFNRWYNMIWMEKMIGEHKSVQPEVKAFPKIQDKIGFERFSW